MISRVKSSMVLLVCHWFNAFSLLAASKIEANVNILVFFLLNVLLHALRDLLRQMARIFTTPSTLLPVVDSVDGGRGDGLGPCLSINVLCRKRELERIAMENKTWVRLSIDGRVLSCVLPPSPPPPPQKCRSRFTRNFIPPEDRYLLAWSSSDNRRGKTKAAGVLEHQHTVPEKKNSSAPPWIPRST